MFSEFVFRHALIEHAFCFGDPFVWKLRGPDSGPLQPRETFMLSVMAERWKLALETLTGATCKIIQQTRQLTPGFIASQGKTDGFCKWRQGGPGLKSKGGKGGNGKGKETIMVDGALLCVAFCTKLIHEHLQ